MTREEWHRRELQHLLTLLDVDRRAIMGKILGRRAWTSTIYADELLDYQERVAARVSAVVAGVHGCCRTRWDAPHATSCKEGRHG